MARLQDKVAIITGGARGLGEAYARLFATEGARVLLGDVRDELGEKVAADIGDGAVYQHLDVTRPDDWAGAVATATDRFGRLDVLVNNAGILRFEPLESMTLESYLEVVSVNQVGCFLGMQAVIPALRAAGGGSIVNISSGSGLEGVPAAVAYVASKWAIRGMTKTAALELGREGIRVNSVHPGPFETPMLFERAELTPATIDAIASGFPIPRVGRAEELAHLVLFLASDESSYCTGAEYKIDGGRTAGQPLPLAVD